MELLLYVYCVVAHERVLSKVSLARAARNWLCNLQAILTQYKYSPRFCGFRPGCCDICSAELLGDGRFCDDVVVCGMNKVDSDICSIAIWHLLGIALECAGPGLTKPKKNQGCDLVFKKKTRD
jgi:hypothetical protein